MKKPTGQGGLGIQTYGIDGSKTKEPSPCLSRNIYHASNWLLGGLENTMLDNPEGSEEYQSAKAALADHDGLVAELYRMATTDVYDDGSCCFSQAAGSFLKDIRFCGKEWLIERCEARIKKAGY